VAREAAGRNADTRLQEAGAIAHACAARRTKKLARVTLSVSLSVYLDVGARRQQ
jgi:hypothetical protein